MDEVADARQAADTNTSGTTAGNTIKLIGELMFRFLNTVSKMKMIFLRIDFTCLKKIISQEMLHTQITYCTDSKTTPHTNDPLFQHMHQTTDNTYKISTHNKRIVYDLLIQIGFWVYSLAKMWMLQFNYDFFAKSSTRTNSNYHKWTWTCCIY